MDRPWRMAKVGKPRQTAALCFVGVHRECFIGPATGVHNMVGTSPNGVIRPGVHNVKNQRAVDRDVWMQTRVRLPGTVTDSGNKLSWLSGWMQGNATAIAQNHKP